MIQAVTILVGAFEDAWKSVKASGAPLGTDKHAPMDRELLAKHFIEAAKQGERDQRQLSQEGVALTRPFKIKISIQINILLVRTPVRVENYPYWERKLSLLGTKTCSPHLAS